MAEFEGFVDSEIGDKMLEGQKLGVMRPIGIDDTVMEEFKQLCYDLEDKVPEGQEEDLENWGKIVSNFRAKEEDYIFEWDKSIRYGPLKKDNTDYGELGSPEVDDIIDSGKNYGESILASGESGVTK